MIDKSAFFQIKEGDDLKKKVKELYFNYDLDNNISKKNFYKFDNEFLIDCRDNINDCYLMVNFQKPELIQKFIKELKSINLGLYFIEVRNQNIMLIANGIYLNEIRKKTIRK